MTRHKKIVKIDLQRYPDNCPPLMVRVWFRVRLSFRVGGQFSSRVIVLEPFST